MDTQRKARLLKLCNINNHRIIQVIFILAHQTEYTKLQAGWVDYLYWRFRDQINALRLISLYESFPEPQKSPCPKEKNLGAEFQLIPAQFKTPKPAMGFRSALTQLRNWEAINRKGDADEN
jgi:hypothetical protein